MSGPRRYVITVDGRQHDVEVGPARGDGVVEVVVDGRRQSVHDAADGDLLVRAGTSGTQVRVTLPRGPSPSSAATPGRAHTIKVQTARQAAAAQARASASGGTGGRAEIEAPMPGRVVAVLVAKGDLVEADTAVIIVEAMKMENEVKTPVAGRVSDIAVEAGVTVDAGQPLCTIEPQ